MFYKDIEDLKPSHFKRLTGVKREVFETMLEAINNVKAKLRKHPTRGTRARLSNAGKLLLMLMCYREYRTQFHTGITYGISESHVCEIIKEMENMPIQDSRFHFPGKKALLKEENHFEVVLVDVTESPVERPEKTEVELFGQEKTAYPKDPNCGRGGKSENSLYGFCQRSEA